MINFYSGTPGSGKSLNVARTIANRLNNNRDIITNMAINLDNVKKTRLFLKRKLGSYTYFKNSDLTVDFLYKYAEDNHIRGKEGQTLIIIDEAQMLFSPTIVKLKNQENRNYRVDWLEFFTQHRRLGYDIILISQFDKLIDAQVRCLFEYNVIHRKVNNFKIGRILSLFKIHLFVTSTYWYGIREKCGNEFFLYSKKYNTIYDSYEFQTRNIVRSA